MYGNDILDKSHIIFETEIVNVFFVKKNIKYKKLNLQLNVSKYKDIF